MPLRAAAACRRAALAILLTVTAAAAQTPAGITATPQLDNPTLAITRIEIAPGAREPLHSHPYSALVVMLSRGEVEVHNGTAQRRGAVTAGDVEFIAAGTPHLAANVGATPLQAIVIALKPDRQHAGTSGPAQTLPGLSRTSLLDNAQVTVTRLEFEPDVREAVHTHGYDMVVVPLTAGPLDLQVADRKALHNYAIGDATFIPRGAPHAAANVGSAPLRLLAVAIK